MTAAPAAEHARAFLEAEQFPWIQRFELAPGVMTPGPLDVAHPLSVAGLPADLTGRTVVDVGTLNGAVAFEAERRGAKHVIAVAAEPPDHYGFDRIADLLGSRVEYLQATLYELPDLLAEPADFAMLLSGLHHFRHPLLALDALRRLTVEHALIQSAVGEQTAFHRRDDLAGDPTNWFIPSPAVLMDWLGSSGFDAEIVDAAPAERPESVVVRATPVPGAPEFAQISTERPLRAVEARMQAGVPPRVEVDLDAPARVLWRQRVKQSAEDSYLGIPLQKMPEALRIYEHLLWLSRPDIVIEIGVFQGASTLWFRDRLRTLSAYGRIGPEPRVIGIDLSVDAARAQIRALDVDWERAIELVRADVLDHDLPERIAERLRSARCLVIEDAAHTYDTTMAALRGFARFVHPGGFFVVEDGYVDVPDLRIDDTWPRGVLPAVDDWLGTDDGARFDRRTDLELYGFSNHPNGILQRKPH
jgi:cephalosporin hydroxylase